MTTRPVPDALMFRDVQPGLWDVRRVPEHRMAAFLDAGWVLLVSSAQIRALDIEDTYHADLRERR